MLTLAMALVAVPRLLMIDELSLGLAPRRSTRRLRDRLRDLRDAGTAIVVVEQSIDRAVELADRAYFLDQRHRPLRRLARRPARAPGTGAARRSSVLLPPASPIPGAPTPVDGRSCRRRVPARRGHEALRRRRRARRRVAHRPSRRDRRRHRPQRRRARRRSSTWSPASCAPMPGSSQCLAAAVPRRRHAACRAHARAQLGLGRSFQDGRLFPALTVRDTIAVACERSVRVRNPVAAAVHLPAVARSEAAVRARSTSWSSCSGSEPYADRFGHELSTGTRRIVDLACVLAHEPDRAPPRRTRERDRPARGRGVRARPARHPRLARRRRARRRARSRRARRRRRSARRARPGAGRGRRCAATPCSTTRR